MTLGTRLKTWARRLKRDGVTLWFALRLVPTDVLAASRLQAEDWMADNGKKPRSRVGVLLVLGLWLLVGVVAYRMLA